MAELTQTPAPVPATLSRLAVFGSVDGLTLFLGLTIGLIVARQGHQAIWHAALGGAAGELVGMTAGQHLSDPDSGWRVAIACGAASGLACVLPAFPYLALTGTVALGAGLGIAAGVAAVITWLRPERGISAIVRTYGILIAAGLLSGLSGLI
jgi:hypothetical protein